MAWHYLLLFSNGKIQHNNNIVLRCAVVITILLLNGNSTSHRTPVKCTYIYIIIIYIGTGGGTHAIRIAKVVARVRRGPPEE